MTNPYLQIGAEEEDNPYLQIGAEPSPLKMGLFDRGVSAATSSGLNMAANILDYPTRLLDSDNWLRKKAVDFKNAVKEYDIATPAPETTAEKVVDFTGRLIPQAVAGGALAKTIFNPITSRLASSTFGKAAERIANLVTKNEAGQAAIGTAITSAPAELAGSYLTAGITSGDEGLKGALPVVGAGIGVGINSLIASRTAVQAIKGMRQTVQGDPDNELFMQAVDKAKQTASDMRLIFKDVFPDMKGKPDPFDGRVPLKAAVYDILKVLKSFEVDGVTAKNIASLEGAQSKVINLFDNYVASNSGNLSDIQIKRLMAIYSDVQEMNLPQYNFAAAVPTVSAIQRLQDNVELDDPIRMNPNAPLGSAESLVAGTRPKSPSSYGAISGWFQKAREQYQNYKSGLQIFSAGKDAPSDPYNLALRLSGNNGRAYQNLEIQPKLLNKETGQWEDAVIDGVKVKSLKQILSEVGTDDDTLSKLSGYLIAKQVTDGNLNITGLTPEWGAREVARIAKESPDVERAANDFFLRTKMMAKYMEDMVGSDVVEEWLKRDYAPASRALQKQGDAFGFLTGRRGGDGLVYNPIAKHIENTSIAIAATEKARMWQKLYDVIKASGSKYANSAEIVEANPKVMQRILDSVKAADPDLSELAARKIANVIGGLSPDKSSKTVSFLKDGKMQSIRFSDDFNELFNGFEGPAEMGMLAGIVQKTESVPRTIFSLVNDLTGIGPMRDLVETYINDPNITKAPIAGPVKMFRDFLKGYSEVANEGPLYQQILASGGGIGGRYIGPNAGAAELGLESISRRAAGESEGWLKSLERISANLSQASRMGAAIRVFEKGGSQDEAAQIFRAVIADPQQVGSKMQAAARITAFMNMGVQSAAKAAEQFKRNPAATAIKGIGGVSVPAAILWYYGKDDQEIQELRGSKGGENYFYLRPYDGANIIRIPKPYLYGQIFGTGIETVLDNTYQTNPGAVDQFMKGVWGQLAVNVLPLSTQALANTALGQKYLGIGEGLIPAGGSTSNQMAEDQRFLNTTTLARSIAERTGISASSVDDLFRTFLTNEPYKALATADRLITGRTAGTIEDLPVIGKLFPTTDKANIASVNRFYKLGNQYADVLASMQDAERKGDRQRLEKIIFERGDDLKQALVFAEGVKDVQELRGAINLINENSLMTPEERREKITQLNTAIRDYTRMFLKSWESSK
jgi:hypothetical protein